MTIEEIKNKISEYQHKVNELADYLETIDESTSADRMDAIETRSDIKRYAECIVNLKKQLVPPTAEEVTARKNLDEKIRLLEWVDSPAFDDE